MPGQAAGRLPPLSAARASRTTGISGRPGGARPPRFQSGGPSRQAGVMDRLAAVASGWPALPGATAPLPRRWQSHGARISRSLPGVGPLTDRNPGRDHPCLPHQASRPSPRHTPSTRPANRRRTSTQVLAAYALLRDPARRAEYDRTTRHAAPQSHSAQTPIPVDRPPASRVQIPIAYHSTNTPPLRAGPVRRHR